MGWENAICCLICCSSLSVCLFAAPEGQKHRAVRRGGTIAGHEILTVLSRSTGGFDLAGMSAILEDPSGEFWIISHSRLYRCRRMADSWLISSPVFDRRLYDVDSIGQTNDGALWMSGTDTGIGLGGFALSFDGTRFRSLVDTISKVPEAVAQEPTFRYPYFAFPGREGREWFAFSGILHGVPQLFSYDGSRWSLPIAAPQEFLVVESGLEDTQGSIWLSSGREIWKFDNQHAKWETEIGRKELGRTMGWVRRIYEDREGKMWFATSWGDIVSCDKSGGLWRSFRIADQVPPRATRPNKLLAGLPPAPLIATDIRQDSRGQMLFATRRGLLAFNTSEHNWEFFDAHNSALPGSVISAVFQDRSGRIWLGTSEGVVILNK